MSITNVITKITVDMAGDVKRFAVKAKQYDRATRVIVVSLLWDEVPYVLDSADTVRCNVHKPDGTIAIIEGDNIAVSGNTVTITLPGTALTAAGRAWADIEIETQDESQQVSCQCFEIDIAKSPVDDDSIISTNEFSAMKLATKAANDAAAAATAEIEATAAAGTAASQAAAAAQAATDAANQAAAAATASIQIDTTLTDNTKAAPAGMVGQIKEDLSVIQTATTEDVGKALTVKTVTNGKVTEWEFGAGSDDGIKALTERYIEFIPEYKVVDGYYVKKGNKIELNPPTELVPSATVTQKIYCKPGYIYHRTGDNNNTIAWGFYFLDDACVGYATFKNNLCTIPDGVNAVVFQGYTPENGAPNLTVKHIHPALFSDVRGESSGEVGQIWTRTEDGGSWANNSESENTGRLKEDVAMLRKAVNCTMNGFSYSLYEGGGHYAVGGKIAWLDYDSANSYFTELIPCYAGQQFLMTGGAAGTSFKKAFFIDKDKETVIGSSSLQGLAIYTIPEGVSYVAFQSSWKTTGSVPTFYVEEYNIVRNHLNIRPLDGIKMTILGDSISMPSTNSYISYLDMLKNDGVEVTNLARSGTGIAVGYGSDTNYYGRLSEIPSDTEFIVVSGSFNDLNRGPSLGTVDDEGTTTIAGYMNQLFSALIEAFPTVPMLIITTHSWSSYKPGTEKSDAYVDMLRQMGLKYGIPFYSLYDKTNLRPWIDACNTKFFRNGDGTHPNTYGHAQLYALLKPMFIKMCYQTSNFLVPGKDPVELST